MSISSRRWRPRLESSSQMTRSVPSRRLRDVAAARLAASQAADVNWSQSISRARTRPRSSEGSLYNLDARPSYRSTMADWSVGLGVIGGLLMLVHGIRGESLHTLSALVGPTLLGIFVGAGAGAVVHWLFGIDERARAHPTR